MAYINLKSSVLIFSNFNITVADKIYILAAKNIDTPIYYICIIKFCK